MLHLAKNARHFTFVLLGRYVFAGFLIVKTTVKTGKSSCVLIVTCLLKLSTQWVKYALACVYTDLPIGELKKKSKNVEVRSRHNFAPLQLTTSCFLPSSQEAARQKTIFAKHFE